MIELNELLENPKDYDTEELNSSLPFLFPNNKATKAQWSLKFLQFQADSQSLIEDMEKQLRQVNLLKETQRRLESLVSAHRLRQNEIQTLFKELGLKPAESDNLKTLMSNRVPSGQHIQSYYLNIFRDWAWGESENTHYNDIAKRINIKDGLALVLGGGPGRLAYDLCQMFENWEVVQLDINPILSLVGQKLSSGEKLKLTEIAAEPLTSQQLSETRQLKAPAAGNPERLRHVLGDASHSPFKSNTFDILITPWLIDIIPEPFESFSRRCNAMIRDAGEWVNFGPLSFQSQTASNQYTSDEVLEQLKHVGFEVLDSGWVEVPYLQSPIRAQQRQERIFWFHAKKIKTCKTPPRHHFYPDWFENPEKKVTLETTNIETLFAQKNLESSILGSLMQGMSINELVNSLTAQTKMTAPEAESLILGHLSRLLETGELVSK